MKLLRQLRYRKQIKKVKLLMADFFASIDLICDEHKIITTHNHLIKEQPNDTKK